MANKIRFIRGLAAAIPTLADGEPGWCIDLKKLFIGSDEGNIPIPGENAANVKTGTYVGDGEASRAITGVGGSPKGGMIFTHPAFCDSGTITPESLADYTESDFAGRATKTSNTLLTVEDLDQDEEFTMARDMGASYFDGTAFEHRIRVTRSDRGIGGINHEYDATELGPPQTTYTLEYIAGDYGSISGDTEQAGIALFGSGTAVEAVPDEGGYYFANWSDGRVDNPRMDRDITRDITVYAIFGFPA